MTKGYTRDGRVTGSHPVFAYQRTLVQAIERQVGIAVFRTIDGTVQKCILTHASLSHQTLQEDPLGLTPPEIWISYMVNGQEVDEKATSLDFDMISQQAKVLAASARKG